MIDMTTDQHIRMQAIQMVLENRHPDITDIQFLINQASEVAKYVFKGVDGENVVGIPVDKLEEMDRNARSYGWEVGHGQQLASKIENISEENPFQDPEWRQRVFLAESQAEEEASMPNIVWLDEAQTQGYVEIPQPESDDGWEVVPESHSEPETEHTD